jgi:hypothetical protein
MHRRDRLWRQICLVGGSGQMDDDIGVSYRLGQLARILDRSANVRHRRGPPSRMD